MADGHIVKTGNYDLAKKIEKDGYSYITKSNDIVEDNNNE